MTINILVSDPTRFGLTPNIKQITLSQIYLLTSGSHPDAAAHGVLCFENSARKAMQVSRTKVAIKHLGTKKEAACWFIDESTGEWEKHHDPISTTYDYKNWLDGKKDYYTDYNVASYYSLYRHIKDTCPWMLQIRTAKVLAHLTGHHYANIRDLRPKLTFDREFKQRCTKNLRTSHHAMREALAEFRHSDLTIVPFDTESESPIVKEYLKQKDNSAADPEAEYRLEKIDIVERSASDIRPFVIKYRGKRRHISLEKGRYATNYMSMRCVIDGELTYFAVSSLTNSETVIKCARQHSAELNAIVEKWEKENPDTLPTCATALGHAVLRDHLDLFKDCEFEVLDNGEWKPFDITVHYNPTPLQMATFDTTKQASYPTTDNERSRHTFCREVYGSHLFKECSMHPLCKMSRPSIPVPHHRMWMLWCEENKPSFSHLEQFQGHSVSVDELLTK